MSRILVGTAGWTDRTLLACGRFYPKDVNTPEKRLAFYAERFPLVEVDATYYAPPTEKNAELWVERTPPEFVFNVKAYSLLTQHPTKPASLYRDLRERLPDELREKRNVYAKDLPSGMVDEVFERFRAALAPLAGSGKLGVVLLQYPPWFTATPENAKTIAATAKKLSGLDVAVELRHGSWLSDRFRARTLTFFGRHELPLVSLDMPQGFPTSLPPVPLSTSKRLALVRFHGKNRETWSKRTETAAERFKYLYPREELEPWVAKIEELAEKSAEVHVIMNNCFEDYAVRNAHDLSELLREHGDVG